MQRYHRNDVDGDDEECEGDVDDVGIELDLLVFLLVRLLPLVVGCGEGSRGPGESGGGETSDGGGRSVSVVLTAARTRAVLVAEKGGHLHLQDLVRQLSPHDSEVEEVAQPNDLRELEEQGVEDRTADKICRVTTIDEAAKPEEP